METKTTAHADFRSQNAATLQGVEKSTDLSLRSCLMMIFKKEIACI